MTLLASYQPLAVIATHSNSTLRAFCQEHEIGLYPVDKNLLPSLWGKYKALVFDLTMGAVVRLIAPLLTDKATDPAVIVLDLQGSYAINLCGGHEGGGEELTRLVAHQLGLTPIITSASTGLNLPGIDILGKTFGWRKGPGQWTETSSVIVRGQPVEVLQECGSTVWQKTLPAGHNFIFAGGGESAGARVLITHKYYPPALKPQVCWHPRVLWVGVGCIRGASLETITRAIEGVCQKYGLAWGSIAGLATIDLKADEVGILEYCQIHDLPLKTFSAEILQRVSVPNPSPVVAEEVGTASVAEAAALSAAGMGELLVTKQIEGKEVTIAIAKANREYIGKKGELYLIGIGPGKLEQMTAAAKTAITAVDVIIGYGLYIDLIQPLLRPGQIIEASPITREQQRADRAIELARWGLKVGVISSGDCGIYAMGGLVLEQLQASGWDGNNPGVEVFPGITAMQAAAARVGAPLMHDFCAISLSDLLTPWPTIEKRLEAAAAGDFVVGLYNPRSQNRQEQIVIGRDILLKYRDAGTPVAIVSNVYRQEEAIILTTLGEMLSYSIDMLTVVLIGNSNTRVHEDWMITPRGYRI
ncbi:MAG: Siroheme synthase [Chroococcopsis gigantea SAG 12.99]|nr:precorrin-3B C(17)-methyltransferase [Chlorogloea purpurea SAG 13.99]MDV2999221.1 Siroheme synthase [Chroococcopsis gigantea SAG 12.99]